MRRVMSVGSCIGGAAVGYVLLVRGALTLDLGLGRRTPPAGTAAASASPRPARPSSTSSPRPIWAGRRGRWAPSSKCSSAAPTWCSRAHFTPLSAGFDRHDSGDGPIRATGAGLLSARARPGPACDSRPSSCERRTTGRNSSTAASWAPTSGAWGVGGASSSRARGSALSQNRSPASRPKPSVARPNLHGRPADRSSSSLRGSVVRRPRPAGPAPPR